jgi:hypothetical protein
VIGFSSSSRRRTLDYTTGDETIDCSKEIHIRDLIIIKYAIFRRILGEKGAEEVIEIPKNIETYRIDEDLSMVQPAMKGKSSNKLRNAIGKHNLKIIIVDLNGDTTITVLVHTRRICRLWFGSGKITDENIIP